MNDAGLRHNIGCGQIDLSGVAGNLEGQAFTGLKWKSGICPLGRILSGFQTAKSVIGGFQFGWLVVSLLNVFLCFAISLTNPGPRNYRSKETW